MKNDFEDFYQNLDKTEIQEQWKIAKNKKIKRTIIALILMVVIDAPILILFKNLISNFGVLGTIFPITSCLVADVIIYVICTMGALKGYNNIFKEKIIDQLLKNFFDEVDYIPNKGMLRETYEEGNYPGYYNRYHSDDYMEGSIDNKYRMKMAEILTQHEETTRDSDGNTRTETTTIFSGLFAKIDIGKSINNELKIYQDKSFRKKDRLDMDSQEFEKYFDVTSTNEIVGMQLLTHDIMDLLIDFRTRIKLPFDILIRNDTMYIRLHVGPMFEGKINRKVAIDEKTVEKYFNIVDFIYSLSKMMIKVVEDTEI